MLRQAHRLPDTIDWLYRSQADCSSAITGLGGDD